MNNIFENISNSYYSPGIYTSVIVSVLIFVFVLSTYEFIVYRIVSHRAFYNRSFNICIAVLPYFIATIVLCLQSNVVITLGTIGALAILRFRTAVKNPVDMLYLLWSVHIGITCGCQLYEVAILTSIAATVVLIVMEYVSIGKKPFVMILHCDAEDEDVIVNAIDGHTKRYRIKSRNYTPNGMNMVFEISVKEPEKLSELIKGIECVDKFSIIEYDSEDIL